MNSCLPRLAICATRRRRTLSSPRAIVLPNLQIRRREALRHVSFETHDVLRSVLRRFTCSTLDAPFPHTAHLLATHEALFMS
jgi:hypothetical protein